MRLCTHTLLAVVAAGALLLTGCDAADPGVGDSAGLTASAPVTALSQAAGQTVDGQYIVVFDNGVADAPGLARRLAQGQGANVLHTYEYALKGFAFRGSAQAAAALARNPNVVRVEADGVVTKVGGTQTNATWGLDRSDARSGLDGTYTYDATGAGVTAYILDTGIRTSHNDFGGRASAGFDAIGDGRNGQDCDGHGTHVAGTVGSSTYGVAKDVDLVAVRVLDCNGSGSYSGVIAGIDWVAANAQKPAVANMSLGGGRSSSVDQAVNNAVASGVAFAVAAGNSNRDACNYSPAAAADAMTVGSTTSSDARSSFSNYGSCVDLFAPGSSITSTWYTSNTAAATLSGTSMASPHVAGAAALYLETNPTASAATVSNAVYAAATPNAVSNASSANDRLLYTLDFSGGGGDTNDRPTAAFSVSTSDLAASFTDASSDADGSVVSWSWSFGDGATSSAQNPSHTYGTAGTYTATLTVTDDDGATASASQSVTVTSAPTGGFSLAANGYKVRGRWTADLTWSGAGSSSVDVYRDGAKVATTANDGAYTDATDNRGGGSSAYRVCEAGTTTCSNQATAVY